MKEPITDCPEERAKTRHTAPAAVMNAGTVAPLGPSTIQKYVVAEGRYPVGIVPPDWFITVLAVGVMSMFSVTTLPNFRTVDA